MHASTRALRAHDPPHAPAGHAVRLRHGADDDEVAAGGVLHGLQRGRAAIPEDEVCVGVVVEEPEAVLPREAGDLQQLLGVDHGTGRVRRAVHDHRTGARGERLRDRTRGDPEVVILRERDEYRIRPGHACGLGERRPRRGRDHDLAAAVEDGLVEERERLLPADGDADLLGREGHGEVLAVAVDDGRAQLRQARGRRVLRPAGVDRRLARRDDVRGRRLVGLSDREVEHPDALLAQGPRLRRHRHGGRDLQAPRAHGQLRPRRSLLHPSPSMPSLGEGPHCPRATARRTSR